MCINRVSKKMSKIIGKMRGCVLLQVVCIFLYVSCRGCIVNKGYGYKSNDSCESGGMVNPILHCRDW